MKLFLDDWRDPSGTISYMMKRIDNAEIYTEGWFVVRSYQEFKEAIDLLGVRITHISFDYDLDMTDGKRKTGLDCAKYAKKVLPRLPEILIHSTNVTGIDKLKKLLLVDLDSCGRGTTIKLNL